VTASVSGGKLTLTAADGSDINVQQTVAGATVTGSGYQRQPRGNERRHGRIAADWIGKLG